MKKTVAIILCIVFIFTAILGLLKSEVLAATQTRDTRINKIDDNKYPGIKSMIQTLQKKHPKWNFKIFYTGLDWNTVIKNEAVHGRNTVPKNYTYWICPECGSKGYSGSSWLCASPDAIAYMMDPRNSLYYEDVFQFLELSYDINTTYDANIIKNILKGSFLDDGNLDNYIKTILDRSKEKNVNPYYIAGKIIQEQGKKGGATVKIKTTENNETKYYYNIFNINASGKTVSAIISNALTWAKAKDWDTIEKCLIGGVDFIANGYITVGQDTMYLEKFDVVQSSLYWHQYAQDVLYAQNQGEKLRKMLEGINATEYAYTFVIPVYENMPKKAAPRPTAENVKNSTTTNKNDETSKTTTVDPSKVNTTDAPKNTTNAGTNSNNNQKDTKVELKYKLGDINDDGTINTGDLLLIRKHILKKKVLKDEKQLKAMDVNKDGTVNTGDVLLIRKHILGKYKIK